MKAKAAVLVADRTIEIREIPIPDAPPRGGAILAVEGCGMCGSDIKQYEGITAKSGIGKFPCIPGHEALGRIAKLDAEATARWGLKEGDRVAVHGIAPCGVCRGCMAGTACRDAFYYGFRSLTHGSGLWGGFAEAMEIDPRTKLYPVSDALSIEDALLFNPLAAGYDWVIDQGRMKVGETVLILGGGQRGLASVIAAAEAGASQIIITGLRRDQFKLDIARAFGATTTLIVEDSDVPEAIMALTGGRGVDLVIETTPKVFQPVLDAIKAVRVGGTIVLGGLKEGEAMNGLPFDALLMKRLRVVGALSSSHWATQQAIRVIESGQFPVAMMHTHTLPIDQLEHAVHLLAGEVPGEPALHISMIGVLRA
jgi:threonine dehydrogenase-like Zn-dependent dehydrogenase